MSDIKNTPVKIIRFILEHDTSDHLNKLISCIFDFQCRINKWMCQGYTMPHNIIITNTKQYLIYTATLILQKIEK